MHRFALFGFPDHLAIGDRGAAFPQAFDQPLALVEIVPEIMRIKPLHLLLGVAEQLPDAGIVEQQPAILVDDVETSRTMVENFPELALMLGALCFALPQFRDVVNPGNALATYKADMTAAIGYLRV